MPDRSPPEPHFPDDADLPAAGADPEAELDALLDSANHLARELANEVGPSEAPAKLSEADLAFLAGRDTEASGDADIDAQLARLDSLAAETAREISGDGPSDATDGGRPETGSQTRDAGLPTPESVPPAREAGLPVAAEAGFDEHSTPLDEFIADEDLTKPAPQETRLDAFGVPPPRSATARPAPKPTTPAAKPASASTGRKGEAGPLDGESTAAAIAEPAGEGVEPESAVDDLTIPLPGAGQQPADEFGSRRPGDDRTPRGRARVSAVLAPVAEGGVRILEGIDKPFARLDPRYKDALGYAAVATLLVAGLMILWSLIR